MASPGKLKNIFKHFCLCFFTLVQQFLDTAKSTSSEILATVSLMRLHCTLFVLPRSPAFSVEAGSRPNSAGCRDKYSHLFQLIRIHDVVAYAIISFQYWSFG